jgi:hypothetical protein
MSKSDSDACPCPYELAYPAGAPGAVADDEELVRIVSHFQQLNRDVDGRPRLTATAITQSDLSGKAQRCVSVLRKNHVSPVELQRRAAEITSFEGWKANPVAAIGLGKHLRAIFDEEGRREICVYADPTTDENDHLGACVGHAGVRRSLPSPDPNDRIQWAVLRTIVAEAFAVIIHIGTNESPIIPVAS